MALVSRWQPENQHGLLHGLRGSCAVRVPPRAAESLGLGDYLGGVQWGTRRAGGRAGAGAAPARGLASAA